VKKNRPYAKTYIDKFSVLVLVEVSGSLAETERIESEISCPAGTALHHLDEGRNTRDNFQARYPEQKLNHRALGNTPVVGGTREGRCVGIKRQLIKVGGKQPEDGKHGDAAVLSSKGSNDSVCTLVYAPKEYRVKRGT
jgi:hypothetical protein